MLMACLPYVVLLLSVEPPAVRDFALACVENQYYEVKRLDARSAAAMSDEERSRKAVETADKLLKTYESLKYLSFTQETTDYWCTEGTLRSRLPMAFWPNEPVATARVWMGLDAVHTEILCKGQPVFSLFVKDMRMWEYRWPQKDVPGAYTEYYHDPRFFRLPVGVDSHLMCVTGGLRESWLGKASERPMLRHAAAKGLRLGSQVENNERLIRQGHWVGRALEQGEWCDVVVLDMEDIDRQDFFFVSARGLLLARYIIVRFSEDHASKYVVPTWYRDIRTEPIPAQEFEPSALVKEASRSWRRLSDEESLAELEKERGSPLKPAWGKPLVSEKKTADGVLGST